MLKSVEKMIKAANDGKFKTTAGNHWMERYSDNEIHYGYHSTVICKVKHGKVTYNNGGWNTLSTTRAINSYKQYYGE